MEGALGNFVRNGAPAPQAQTQPVVQNGQAPMFAGQEYVTGDELNRVAPQIVGQAVSAVVAPQIAKMNEQMANMALDRVQVEHKADFDRYGPEIYGYLSRLDKTNGSWTVDNLKQVVNMVRANHLDELLRDARQSSLNPEPAVRSNGAAPISSSPSATDMSIKSEQLPAEYREKLQKAQMTEAAMDEFCRANNMSRADFFKLFANRQAITEAPRT